MDFQTWFATLGVNAEGYQSLSFKINVPDLKDYTASQVCGALVRYVDLHSEGESKFLTVGEHRQGTNEVPHYHFNFAVPTFMKTSNESRRRSKYLDEMEGLKLEHLSCKVSVIKSVFNLEDCLKYPLKERVPLSLPVYYGYLGIPKEVQAYMIESAYAMFLASEEQIRKKSRASERSANLLDLINDLAGSRTFQSYQEFKEIICKDFFLPLELHEYPDMAIFRKALEKVAVKKGIVPFHYFI